MKAKLIGALAALVLCTGPSQADTYTADGITQGSLGAQFTSDFDIIILSTFAGPITGPGTYRLNPLEFIVGINAYKPYTFTGTLTQNINWGGNTKPLTIAFSIIISTSDTLVIPGGETLFFPGYKLVVDALLPPLGPVGPYTGSQKGELTATVTAVPIPASLPLFAGGLGLMGWLAGRRRGQAARA